MTMLVDVGKTPLTFQELSDELAELEKALGVQIQIQREEVFNYMYRL
jgi:ACT domain-containing protein